jgi:AraC family transcriptional regulator, ethanolamine operon transcriptional activator
MFPTGVVVDSRTANCQELEAASIGWDVRYVQLGEGGSSRCRHVAIHTARLQLSFETWSLGMLKTGRGPRGSVAFLVPLARSGSCRFQGRPCVAGDVFALFDGDDLDFRSAGPAQLVSVSIERTTLERHTRTLLGRHLGELRLEGRLRGLRTNSAILRGLCHETVGRAAAHPWLLRDAAHANRLETKLVKALFSGFETPRDDEAPRRSRTLARNAEAWLRQNLADAPPIASLCEALDTSERRLHEAFREHLGTTPKAYLKTLRLNAARRDLLGSMAKTRVTDVALDWGFSHFGWFSQDYRRLFGETPSRTLQRGRTEAAGDQRFFARPENPSGHGLTPAVGFR